MENKKLILYMALAFVLLLIWQAWQQDYGAKPGVTTAQPAAEVPAAPEQPADAPSVPAAAASNADAPAAPGPAPEVLANNGQRIRVSTDVLQVEINSAGGDLRRLDLLAYPVAANKPDEPFRLFNEQAEKLFIAQSGLLSQNGAPDHHAAYQIAQTEYRLAPNSDEIKVPLTWTGPQGVQVTKTYTFKRGSYEIGLSYEVKNTGAEDWKGRLYAQFQRAPESGKAGFIYTYTGAVLSGAENKYEKISFDDMKEKNLARDVQGGWAALLQHYFVGAWVPDAAARNHYYTKALAGVSAEAEPRYLVGVVQPEQTIASGQSATLAIRLYAGPKLQDHLKEIAPNLDLTVDYGVLTVIAQPLFWLLEYIHGVVGNWGWAIVLLTLLVKLVFYHLSAASYRSMANMRKLQPRIQSIRERHGDDRQAMGQAMMALYKTEKINPLGGCLPMVVQIPVFIALYWVLLESVELRQADFVLWLNDLSSKDPYYILPLIMGVTMLIQQKLSPPPPDPLQAKVMMILPIVFTFFFAFFPSGLVLYWVVNNALSILQQWHITRKIVGSEK
ncbi:MAG: membrane protein insertase YidC [Gammaproteobacteria bacterium]|nr:membrane protein insertase YidC [Gammaproteobacteria bacterium]